VERPAGRTPEDPARAAPLPSGTLTLLLTESEGSGALWEQHPTAMQATLARHDALVGAVQARHGGQQAKERGERGSILAVFTSPAAALAAACALQGVLLAEPWPPRRLCGCGWTTSSTQAARKSTPPRRTAPWSGS
jgi:hypothetical protein